MPKKRAPSIASQKQLSEYIHQRENALVLPLPPAPVTACQKRAYRGELGYLQHAYTVMIYLPSPLENGESTIRNNRN